MGLIIPKRLNEKPTLFCTLCPKAYYADEHAEWQRHVLGHPLEEVQAQTLSHQAPGLFGNKGGDDEWAAWVDHHRAIDPKGLEAHRWMRTDAGKHSSGIGDG